MTLILYLVPAFHRSTNSRVKVYRFTLAAKHFMALMLHVTFHLTISYGIRACTGKEKRSLFFRFRFQIMFDFKHCNC